MGNLLDHGRPLIMAHRGDSAAAPENTLLSMQQAIEIGVDVLETDVRLTKDNQLVLFHDDDLERTTGLEGTVREFTLRELREIDLGYGFTLDDGATHPFRDQGHTIVTLAEILKEFPDTIVNIDIKDEDVIAPEILSDVLSETNRERSVIVASFHEKQLERFRKLMPEVTTSAHPGEVTRFVFGLKMHATGLFARGINYKAFQVPMAYGRISVISERFVKAAHNRNIAVHVWTINKREQMEELIDLGVDGIFTDEPALLRKVLADQELL